MDKQKEIKKIEKEIENCRICKIGKSGKAVVGEGNINAKIMFVGEAPGKNESKTGRPFIGRSGKLLRGFITQNLGLKESDVYITSPVKYLPNRGTPTTADIKHGNIHFLKQVKIINPKIMVLLGSTAAFAVLDEKIPVLKRHGGIIKRGNVDYFLTLHPAAVLRFPGKFKRIYEEDFKKLKDFL